MKYKYQLLIIWGDVEPELDQTIHESYEDLFTLARRVRETEGDGHGLFYLCFKQEGDNLVLLEVGSFAGSDFEEEEEEE
jgi:hypothetical protein